MGEYRETFKRKEVKYRLNAVQRKCIESAVRMHMQPSEFACSMVNSVYLDTSDRCLIGRSLEKPLYKEKLRLRWYGNCAIDVAQDVFVEIKKKFAGTVYKRRIRIDADDVCAASVGLTECSMRSMHMDAFWQRVSERSGSVLDTQIKNEIEAFVCRYELLRPSALIRCMRMAYQEPSTDETCGLRITFDFELEGEDLFACTTPIPLLGEGESIMEIKCSGPYPKWLIDVLGISKSYSSSFSKYGELYKLLSVNEPEQVIARSAYRVQAFRKECIRHAG